MRQSYGHSVIIDPWGHVIADKGHGEGVCYADIDLQKVQQVRESIPLHLHRRVFGKTVK